MRERGWFSRSFHFYGGLGRKVLADRLLFASFALAATLQALGHGATALAAGLLGRALSVEPHLISPTFRLVSSPATLAFVGVIATMVKGGGATISATLQSRLVQGVAGSARRRIADRLLSGGSPLPTGQLSARLAVRIRELEVGVQDGVLGGLRAALTLLPLGVALYMLSSALAVGAMLVLAPFAVATALARRAWRRSHLRAVALAEGLHQEVDELVVHMDVWRSFGAGARVCRALEDLGEEAATMAGRAEGARAALSSANEVLAAAALLACVCTARAFSLDLGDGTLIAFATVFFMSYRPLRDLGDARSALERGVLALDALERLAPNRGTLLGVGGEATRIWGRDVLVVKNLRVCRDDTEGQGRDAAITSFCARPGEIVAIAGATGSGKTTLLRALLGLESASGEIYYGAEELTHRGVGPHDRPFAWVPQDAPVMAGTLEDNVSMGAVDSHAVADALGSIGAEKLATEWRGVTLGATGRPVSGGERKWIALARAIATGLPVLLLDEPTAGLDSASEARVLAALQRLRGGRTILLVSHQDEPLRIADRVIRIARSTESHPREASTEGELESPRPAAASNGAVRSTW
jgi:ABC-type transport system involved in cytochrome bd biosynthesis fused ATPase/permease subunit